MTKFTRWLAGFLLGILCALPQGHAAGLQWSSKTCVTIDSSFYLCKPTEKWDTQQTNQASRPVKFVHHKQNINPEIWVAYDESSNAGSAEAYANHNRSRFESRGIRVDAVTKEVFAGREVYIVAGADQAKGMRYATALFWTPKFRRSVMLEFTAGDKDYSGIYQEFLATVQSFKDLR